MGKKRAEIKLEAVVYEEDEEEIRGVVITGAMFSCTKCHALKPATEFGLRMTHDGIVRNQAQCKSCR